MNRLTKPIGSYINLTTGLDKSPHIINLLTYLTINSLICLLLAYPSFREKDNNSPFSIPTLQKIKIHFFLHSFLFSLHLTLVNSCKNKNREMMTHTHLFTFIYPCIYYIFYLAPCLFFTPLIILHNKNFFFLFILIFTPLHSRKFL